MVSGEGAGKEVGQCHFRSTVGIAGVGSESVKGVSVISKRRCWLVIISWDGMAEI